MMYNDFKRGDWMRKLRLALALLSAVFGIGGTVMQLVRSENIMESLSYFTTLSNIAAGMVFFAIFIALLKRNHLTWLYTLAHTASVALVVTFIIYHFTLRPTLETIESLSTIGGPLDLSLHYITPLLALMAFLLLPPKKAPLWKASIKPLWFPFAYLAYIIIYVGFGGRFRLDGVYYRQPYFFLDIETYGLFMVMGFIILLAIFFTLISALLYVSNHKINAIGRVKT